MTTTADPPTAPTATDRLVSKLQAAARGESVSFSPAQVAYLMGAAAQWRADTIDGEPSPLSYRAGFDAGYQARVAEENAAYPPPPYDLVPTARQNARQIHRLRSGADNPEPREGDFQGFGTQYVLDLRERWSLEDGDGNDQD